jgi:hypothetical protein
MAVISEDKQDRDSPAEEVSDPEKATPPAGDHTVAEVNPPRHGLFYRLLVTAHVEQRGVQPVPLEERTNTRFFNVFAIWFCMNINLIP